MLVDFHSPNSNIKGTEIEKRKIEILRQKRVLHWAIIVKHKDYRLRGINSKSTTIREACVNEKLLTIIIIKNIEK